MNEKYICNQCGEIKQLDEIIDKEHCICIFCDARRKRDLIIYQSKDK